MPIYAYKCSSCQHEQDVLRKVSDPPLTLCPACGASTFAKQLTAAGFQLKGSGWYATDFKNGSARKGGADGRKADAGGGKEAASEGAKEVAKEASKESAGSGAKDASKEASKDAGPSKPAPGAAAGS